MAQGLNVWHWTMYQNGTPAMSGDNSRNFKNEADPEIDGSLFADEPISSAARFLAREVIQNSVDASRDTFFTNVFGEGHLRIHFRFEELFGEQKQLFIESLNLVELRERSQFLDASAAAATSDNCLRALDTSEPLRVLFVDEYGASGMYGPWDDELGTSRMSIALLSGNISEKPENAGGAYGHGKSVNAMASKIRVNVAYSCFTPDETEPEISRRLLGVTYWPDHRIGKSKYLGWGIMGGPGSDNQRAIPWTNADADENALKMGFSVRRLGDRESAGTSLLIVDPAMQPSEISLAVQRYWWPAIEQGFLRVEVSGPGEELVPVRPRTHPIIKNFVSALNGILAPSDQPDSQMRVRDAGRVNALGKSAGQIALVPAPEIGDANELGERFSVVAKMRGLGMVVSYQKFRIGPAFVHGVFLANFDDEIERLLNKSEPKAHDKWLENADESNPELKEKIRLLVRRIAGEIRNQVRQYSHDLTPEDDGQPVRFRELDRLLGSLISDDGTKPPPVSSEKRDFSIHRTALQLEALKNDELTASGVVKIQRLDEEITRCQVAIRFFIRDDQRRSGELQVEYVFPKEFAIEEDDQTLVVGECGPDPFEIAWKTEPYSRLWVGDLDVGVTRYGS
jgi:hypothetical protein